MKGWVNLEKMLLSILPYLIQEKLNLQLLQLTAAIEEKK